MEKITIGFIGAGNMAWALIKGILRLGIRSRQIFASDPDKRKLKKIASFFIIHPLPNNIELVRECRVIVLATKPQEIKTVLQEIAPEIKNQLIISIAAGVDTSTLAKNLKNKNRTSPKIIRAMPNNPALIGEGITALYSKRRLTRKEREASEQLFRGAGDVLWVKKEEDLDAVTGLSGSGPAYVYRFVEALVQAGEKNGLEKAIAHRLALKTVIGSALTLHQTGTPPSELIPLVTSKKGTTLEGLKVLDRRGFNKIVHETVRAATRRAREIRKELK